MGAMMMSSDLLELIPFPYTENMHPAILFASQDSLASSKYCYTYRPIWTNGQLPHGIIRFLTTCGPIAYPVTTKSLGFIQ